MVKRGEIYLVKSKQGNDPKQQRPYIIVSRQMLVQSSFSTLICAPIFTYIDDDMSTQVVIGINEGLKHDCAIYCDNLESIARTDLTNFKGSLNSIRMAELDEAIAIATGLK